MIYFPKDVKEPTPYYSSYHRLVGYMEIPDGLVDITDPGYERDTWCAKFDFPVKPGRYGCYINIVNFLYKVRYEADDIEVLCGTKKVGQLATKSDNRIVTITIQHSSLNERTISPNEWELVTDQIGVDAGLCGFYNHKPDFTLEDKWMEFCGNLQTVPKLLATCDIKPYGITVSSGFGDGVYSLYKYVVNNEVLALKVEFN